MVEMMLVGDTWCQEYGAMTLGSAFGLVHMAEFTSLEPRDHTPTNILEFIMMFLSLDIEIPSWYHMSDVLVI